MKTYVIITSISFSYGIDNSQFISSQFNVTACNSSARFSDVSAPPPPKKGGLKGAMRVQNILRFFGRQL